MTAVQERVARLTGRFKDQTFIDLDRSVQIKTMETFLDTSVKNRKGVLPYATTTSIEAVVKLAPWWPAEVTYAPPRKMVQDDLNTVFAALVRHADATDDMLMRKLEASVGTLGVDMVVQLAIMASMNGLMSKEADMQRTNTNSGWPDLITCLIVRALPQCTRFDLDMASAYTCCRPVEAGRLSSSLFGLSWAQFC